MAKLCCTTLTAPFLILTSLQSEIFRTIALYEPICTISGRFYYLFDLGTKAGSAFLVVLFVLFCLFRYFRSLVGSVSYIKAAYFGSLQQNRQ